MTASRRLLIALGGNALEGANANVGDQAAAARRALSQLLPAITESGHILISHGNGPQVGNLLLRAEMGTAAGSFPPLPLDTCVADTIGGLGYLITRELRSALDESQSEREVAAIITTTVVTPADTDPVKPIGGAFPADQLEALSNRGWKTVVAPQGGIRRTVSSPPPMRVLELEPIRLLFDAGVVVVAGGGGGVPVTRAGGPRSDWVGVEAVVDKDLVSSLLATQLACDALLILTDIDGVRVGFGLPSERRLANVRVAEVREHLREGAFGQGSMAPKVEAACRFVESGGQRAAIGHLDEALGCLNGTAGTQITVNGAPPEAS